MTMRIPFTKMQGAGNDFVVLDETRTRYRLNTAQYRWLADRHFGVGADQILTVRPSPSAGIDFQYIIHNADGGEVEQCGNGARCFARFVREQGLTPKDVIRVQTRSGVIELTHQPDGRVTVDMGTPVFDLERIPFRPAVPSPCPRGPWEVWPLPLEADHRAFTIDVSVVSIGNPHAVLRVDDIDRADVQRLGPLIEHHPCFPNRTNAGFMQAIDRHHIRLRVYERGSGETLACGTGACAAAVTGIRLGLLDSPVDVTTNGGLLTIDWAGAEVTLTGPAATVFHGTLDLPDI